MRNVNSAAKIVLCALFFFSFDYGDARGQGDTAAKKNIEALLDTYQKCVRDADTNLLFTIWPEDRSISYVNPSERIQSAKGLAAFWQNAMGKRFTKRELRRKNVSIHIANDFAWAVFDWDFTATLPDGKPFTSSGWETQLYRKTNKGWKIVHIHYSVPLPSAKQGKS
jgi:ketosteroid isomerase-like protein